MAKLLHRHRYLLSRRLVQAAILFLLMATNLWGWRILSGNLSFSRILQSVPLADPYAVLQITLAGGLNTGDMVLGAGLSLFFYAVLTGRTFCAWVCPVNPITDLANWVRRQLTWRKSEVDRNGTEDTRIAGADNSVPGRRTDRRARYWILGLSLLLSLLCGLAAFEMISPVALVHRSLIYGAGLGLLVIPALFLYDLLVHRNGFCGHLCPLGALYTMTTGWSRLRVRHDHQACTRCQKCRQVCPENQILDGVGERSGLVLAGECTNCGRCVEVCEDRALAFGVRGFARTPSVGG